MVTLIYEHIIICWYKIILSADIYQLAKSLFDLSCKLIEIKNLSTKAIINTKWKARKAGIIRL